MSVSIAETSYGGHRAVRLANGEADLVVLTDVGPRIQRYGWTDGPNFFKEMTPAEESRLSGEQGWKVYGGHRIWVGPERASYSYAPDNEAPLVETGGDWLRATSPVDSAGIEKEIEARLAAEGSEATITHRLTNRSQWPLRFAPWTLSMMAPGGAAVAPFPTRGTHPEDLPPSNPLVMWAFTNWTDPRWSLLERYLVLRQDPGRSSPEKAGLFRPLTAAAYLLGGDAFVKTYEAEPGLEYPDMGCSLELFANEMFLEIETLGPIRAVEPDETIEHVERWSLHRDVRPAAWNDEELDRVAAPLFDRG
ncbi:MAG: hypothetical protein GC160_26035 [Acidobacteria bacterium]|nr:hypothetical protein [Acidobacteriota bacterium]